MLVAKKKRTRRSKISGSLNKRNTTEVGENIVLHLPMYQANEMSEDKPYVIINEFTIYDQQSNLVPIEMYLCKTNITLYMSGCIEPGHKKDPYTMHISRRIKTGKILKWVIRDLPGPKRSISIIITTSYGFYELQDPSRRYAPIMGRTYEKIWLSQLTLEYLRENIDLDLTYGGLLSHLSGAKIGQIGKFSEMMLHRHAQYVCTQVNFCKHNINNQSLLKAPCMQHLMHITGVKCRKAELSVTFGQSKSPNKVITTPLIQRIFEEFLLDNPEPMEKRQRYNFNLLLCILVWSEFRQSRQSRIYKVVKWIGEPIKQDKEKIFYESVTVNGAFLKIGDYVTVEPVNRRLPPLVTRIVSLWKYNRLKGFFHAQVFMRSRDTVLGNTGDQWEVFLTDRCCHNVPLSSVIHKVNVIKVIYPDEWSSLGGLQELINEDEDMDEYESYYCSKYYDRFTCRFIDLPSDPICLDSQRKHSFCPSCERKTLKELQEIPVLSTRGSTSVIWRNHSYEKGSAVFLKPGTFKLKNNYNLCHEKLKVQLEKVNETEYPEYYRKNSKNIRGSNFDTAEPFCVGYIEDVTIGPGPKQIFLKVRILYRPENTNCRFPQCEDLNLVYWSDDFFFAPFSAVTGPCTLAYAMNIPDDNWLEADPSRMYFSGAYDPATGEFQNVPREACHIRPQIESPHWERRPLRTLDLFAGCGGLSLGMHQSGVADCTWAIEKEDAEANAYLLNNPHCMVFQEDCNVLLDCLLKGNFNSSLETRLPKKGEVELICGGPPCQGFSGMNRFNTGKVSTFNNSLIATFLSYCEYYRPAYIVMENVETMASFKNGIVLKLTLKALLKIGYQCTFGVLQAGNFGVPQTRRRLIIYGAAPGFKLPLYPEPTNTFNKRACNLSVAIDRKIFRTNAWNYSAPRRTCTIRDAIDDLPAIHNGSNKILMNYDLAPQSPFQRLFRSGMNDEVTNHICKRMSPLVQARISLVPLSPGSDWRDLPNKVVLLSDFSETKVLKYCYDDIKNGRASNGNLRGVCRCATGATCDHERQENTLIPWCLPHTANRQGNWSGLYGRLSWEGYFSTTVTDPEPMGMQGRVLHPEQNRVVSVRECARSQGFPDSYRFWGTIAEKHRQVIIIYFVYTVRPAAVTLANLSGEYLYRPGLFLLYPLYRTPEPPTCDTLLVHGLRGGVFVTWRQRDRTCFKPIGLLEVSITEPECDPCKENETEAKYYDPELQQVLDDIMELEEEALLSNFEVVLHDLPIDAKREPLNKFTFTADKKINALIQEEEDRCNYTFCWPKDWLPKDCKNLRILGINYWTSLSEWLEHCPLQNADISTRASELIPILVDADVGRRNVVWLTHSMGGLIVKQLLIQASESGNLLYKQLCDYTKAIVFYSTPHRGSALATMPRAAAAILWPSQDVQQLQENSPSLLKIHQEFIKYAERYGWETISFAETLPTPVTAFKVPIHFVEPFSADLGRGIFYQLPLDHLSICKPATRQSILYTTVLDVLRRAIAADLELQNTNNYIQRFIHFLFWTARSKLKTIIEILDETQSFDNAHDFEKALLYSFTDDFFE
ncbi:unnamed protein product [Leptosia nina]|uniref:DNA (cytosine-5-)-methyltransferase n=1 Tax=Leptosia nina TaxID=320188 RepID=A0AAV1K2Z1_9NEOP